MNLAWKKFLVLLFLLPGAACPTTGQIKLNNNTDGQTGDARVISDGIIQGPPPGQTLINTYTAGEQGQNSASPLQACATFANGNFLMIWPSEGQDGSATGLYGQLFNSDGSRLGTEFQVNTITTGAQGAQSAQIVPLTDGRFAIIWDGYYPPAPDTPRIWMRTYLSTGAPYGTEAVINTNARDFPSAGSFNNNSFVVAYSCDPNHTLGDICAQRFASDGKTNGTEFIVNTYTTDAQLEPRLATHPDGRFIISWVDQKRDGSENGIYAQLFSAAGTRQGPEFRINASTPGTQNHQALAMFSDGGFIAVWQNRTVAGSTTKIWGQRFTSDGTTNGSEFIAPVYAGGDQTSPDVVALSDGSFWLAWYGAGLGTRDKDEIYLRLYGANGTPAGPEQIANSITTGNQRFPHLAAFSDGRFLLFWSGDTDGSGFGVFANAFHADGKPL